MEIRENIKTSFKDAVEESFGDLAIYSFLVGSFCYSPHAKSDIDICVLLNNDVLQLSQDEILQRRRVFNKHYRNIHLKNEKKLDPTFPGEIICEGMLTDVKSGRGFKTIDGKVRYDPLSGTDDAWLTDPCLEYRCWRSMFFFTDSHHFIEGNRKKFEADRLEVLDPLLIYLLQNLESREEITHYEDLERKLIQKIKSSEKNEFGYSKIYKESLFRGDRIQGIPIMEVLKRRGIIKDGKYDENSFQMALREMVGRIERLPKNCMANKFLLGLHET